MTPYKPASLSFAILGIALVFQICGLVQADAGLEKPGGFALEVEFRAMWWSEAQMEGLNPDSPPPKHTEVILKRWEYTDPIGAPHPDEFDILVRIVNKSGKAIENLTLHGQPRWKIGSIRREKGATWQVSKALESIGPFNLEAGATRTVRFPKIDLKGFQEALFKQDKWAWAFAVEVQLFSAANQQRPLEKAVAQLPIFPGD
jgi:hypothetical protein